MPEDNQNPVTPPGTDPKPPENGSSQTSDIDFTKLTDDQLAKVYDNPNLFKHPRFKELAQAKQERDQLVEKQRLADEAKLAEEGKYKELVTKKDDEIKALSEKIQNQAIDSQIERLATKAGVSDSEAALKLINRGAIKYDSKTGEISGVEEAVKQLVTEKPYLVGKGNDISIGTPSNPSDANTQLKRFKLSQLQDPKFYQENEKDILASIKAGLVEDDLNQK